MFNVLVLSDIHIGIYRNYNQDDFRLKQFIKLKDVIIDTIQKNNVKEVWIAGDLLLTAQSTPQVMAVVKNFLKDIASNAIIRLVLGNHDLVVRTDKTDILEYNNYTLISLLDDVNNINIYNDNIIDINNKKVYFHSWTPNNFERKDADYLVCHGDAHKSLSPFSEHYIDCKGYKKVFCGHIHIYKCIDNLVSLGTPLMHSFSDSQDVGFVLYDLDTDTLTRISTQGMFLEFKYAESDDEAKEMQQTATDNNQDAVVKVKEVKLDDELKNVSISDLDIDPKNVINQFTENLSDKSKSIVNTVISDCTIQSSVPDLRITLNTLKCKNFLSIKELEFNFNEYKGLTTIKGEIGAGKSTLFNLVEFMFFGKLSGYNKSDYQSVYTDKFSGSLSFEYKGSQYLIERTLSTLQYSKDGKYVESNKKNDLQKDLEEELGFLDFWNLIYIKQSSTGIFSDMSDTNRVSFLSKLIGLNTIKLWTDNLSSKIKELNDNTSEKNLSIAKLETQLNSLTEYNASNQEHSTFIDLTSLQSNIEKCNEKIKTFNDVKTSLNNDIIKANSEIISIENKKKNAESLIIVINNALKKITELKEENQRLSTQPLELKETVKIDDVYAKIAEYDTKILELSNKISLGNDKLNSLVNHPDICPTCKQPWHIDNLDYKITVLKDGIGKLNNELENFKTLKQNEQTRIIENNRIIDSNNKIMNIKNTILMNENKILELKEGLKANFEKLSDFEYILENNLITSIRLKKDDTESLKINIAAMHGNIADLDVQIQNVQSEMSEFNQKIGIAKINNEIYNTIIYNNEKIKNLSIELDSLKADILDQKNVIDELSKFNTKILSDKGLLVASLLQRVSEYLNTDELLQVETVHTMQNGSLKPTLNIKLFVKEYNKYVDYTMLSGGQRLQADLRFLKGITNSLGSVSVLFMDETFKYFSSDAVYTGIDIINDMKVDKVFLIIHGMNNEQLSDNNILVTLSDKGSKYTKV